LFQSIHHTSVLQISGPIDRRYLIRKFTSKANAIICEASRYAVFFCMTASIIARGVIDSVRFAIKHVQHGRMISWWQRIGVFIPTQKWRGNIGLQRSTCLAS
jgi:hypothetical protein